MTLLYLRLRKVWSASARAAAAAARKKKGQSALTIKSPTNLTAEEQKAAESYLDGHISAYFNKDPFGLPVHFTKGRKTFKELTKSYGYEGEGAYLAPFGNLLTREELTAVTLYTDTMLHGGMNKDLRAGKTSPGMEEASRLLSNAIQKLPTSTATVHRRTRMDRDKLDAYKVGAAYEERGYLSTSDNGHPYSPGNTDNPDKVSVVFNIKSKRGREVRKLSQFPEEKEVLFDRGATFRVSKLERDGLGWRVHMEEL